jgi:TM2 domain-containing membrane protein YozV/ribosomal protein L40E
MFCGNCGKKLTGAPKICSSCGARPMFGTHFCPECGAQTTSSTEVCVRCGARIEKEISGYISPKSRLATTLLAFFLGTFGAHRFYVGKIGTAIIMLLLGIAGIANIRGAAPMLLGTVGLWAFIDFIFAVTGHMKDRQGRLIQKW